jgi:hypothetical protein
VEEVLRALDLKARGYLTLHLGGEDFRGDEAPRDPVTVLADLAFRAKEQLPKSSEPYFGLTEDLRKANDELSAAVRKKVESELGVEMAGSVKAVLKLMVQTGRTLGEVVPKAKQYLDLSRVDDAMLAKLERHIDEARKSFALGGSVTDRLRRAWRHAGKRDRLVRDGWRAMGEDFYTDLVAILAGWHASPKSAMRHLPEKVVGKDHLFLFVDDYECIQNDFGTYFLVRVLLPKLAEAPFQSTLLMSGRDDLGATEPGWYRTASHQLREHTIRLAPLSQQDVGQILSVNQIADASGELAKRIYRDTDGYPLLVEMAIDEQGREGTSVVALKKFYDRQTYWMSPLQKMWLDHLCFLDEVNLETIPRVLPSEDADAVFEWFEKEGSIRDTLSSKWVVRSFVRSRVLEYFRSKRPSAYHQLVHRARADATGTAHATEGPE